MANHTAALKSIRQTAKRTKVNQSRMTRIRSLLRVVDEAIAKGKKADAEKAFKAMQPKLMRGVQKNLFHVNNAGRKLARRWVQIKNLSA